MIREYLKDKAIGFWFSVSLVLLTAVTAIVYVSCIATVVLILLKKFEYASYAAALLIFLSLLFFIYGIYYYVSVVLVGIDLDSFSAEFIACTVLYALTFGLGVANVFLRPLKKETDKEEKDA